MAAEFVSYLWGIETLKGNIWVTFGVLSLYLTYEGLKRVRTCRCLWRKRIGLYLTYEGLKLKIMCLIIFSVSVCILPMRDWNPKGFTTLTVLPEFVSYLWGIETILTLVLRRKLMRLYLTYEGLKPYFVPPDPNGHRVCILPMRDWNMLWISHPHPLAFVCILPMRDWN